MKTEVSAVGKQQTTDPDVKLNQTYTADINGQQVKVPVTKGTALGTTGVIKQEVDLTPVVDMAMRITRETYGRGNWEVSTGLGREQNHWYIPVELKRNYNKDESLSLELHVAPTEDKRLSGGELKYGRKFN
nr:hypothetical protein [uncultured Anaeromusa sp.]